LDWLFGFFFHGTPLGRQTLNFARVVVAASTPGTVHKLILRADGVVSGALDIGVNGERLEDGDHGMAVLSGVGAAVLEWAGAWHNPPPSVPWIAGQKAFRLRGP
jgi:hypothetical protein